MADEDFEEVMRHPETLFGSDGLPTSGGRPHPRLSGTFPRILGHYIRARGVLSLEAAIAKMTGRAAARFGLTDRGVLRVGAWADMVLFAPEDIDAGSTYEDPFAPPRGIEGVWVNGERVVDAGQITGARAGRVLRRAP
jgi:N-acyl-D-aspartate/D-glutamate deacylase